MRRLIALFVLLQPLNAWAGSSTLIKGDILEATTSGRIGTTGAPDSKAVLDLVSTTLGFLPPRMTTTQRDAISSPTEALACYNSTTKFPNFYNGTSWLEVLTATGTQTVTGKTLNGNTATNLVSGSGTFTFNTSGTVTAPNATDTLMGKATTDVMTNKSFDADGTGNSITNIENADIKAAAAIAVNKLAALTASRPVSTDGSGFLATPTATLSVAFGGTALASGTSGGILGYTGSGTLASSVALTASQLVLGGGAGATPTALAAGSQYVPLTMGAANPGYTALALDQSAATSGQLLVSRGGTGVATANAGTFFGGPTSGAAAAPSFKTWQPPTVQKFTSGTAATYTTATGALYIRVRMVGAGGGGSGSGTAGGTAAGNGTDTTFGTSLLSAGGGLKGVWGNTVGGAGGTSSLGSGPIGTALSGSTGDGSAFQGTTIQVQPTSGRGGSSFFGGGGASVQAGVVGNAGATNTGGGGAGGGCSGATTTFFCGTGGGSGGFVDAIITSPSATYTYTVGAAGSAGALGTNGYAGGAGAAGYIEVIEYYQ